MTMYPYVVAQTYIDGMHKILALIATMHVTANHVTGK